jgi:alanyl-tRNA synthetase
MQKYKPQFANKDITDLTIANCQACMRLNDISEIGDGSHLLYFNMLGLFSFREWTMEEALDFWVTFLDTWLGITISHVTVHPDKEEEWSSLYSGYIPIPRIHLDRSCKWSDGEIGGYCTEFYVDDVEVGNIVNPLGDCIDAGFGLERLDYVVNNIKPKSALEILEETIEVLLQSGYAPSNKQQGSILRALFRKLIRLGGKINNYYYEQEKARFEQRQEFYLTHKDKYADKDAVWWLETHGVYVEDMN